MSIKVVRSKSIRQRPPLTVLSRADSSATDSSTRSQTSSASSHLQYAKKTNSFSSAITTQEGGSQPPPNLRPKSEPLQSKLPFNDFAPPVPPKDEDSPEQDPSQAWKLEFRGVVKLVRWVSTKSNKKTTTAHTTSASVELDASAPKLVARSATSHRRSTSSGVNKPLPPIGAGAPTGKLSRGYTLLEALQTGPPVPPAQRRVRKVAMSTPAGRVSGDARPRQQQASSANASNRADNAPPAIWLDEERNAETLLNSDASLSEATVRASLHDRERSSEDVPTPPLPTKDLTLVSSNPFVLPPSLLTTASTATSVSSERVHARRQRRRQGLSEFHNSLSLVDTEDAAQIVHNGADAVAGPSARPITGLPEPPDDAANAVAPAEHPSLPLSPQSTVFSNSHSQDFRHTSVDGIVSSDAGHGGRGTVSEFGHSTLPRTTVRSHRAAAFSDIGHQDFEAPRAPSGPLRRKSTTSSSKSHRRSTADSLRHRPPEGISSRASLKDRLKRSFTTRSTKLRLQVSASDDAKGSVPGVKPKHGDPSYISPQEAQVGSNTPTTSKSSSMGWAQSLKRRSSTLGEVFSGSGREKSKSAVSLIPAFRSEKSKSKVNLLVEDKPLLPNSSAEPEGRPPVDETPKSTPAFVSVPLVRQSSDGRRRLVKKRSRSLGSTLEAPMSMPIPPVPPLPPRASLDQPAPTTSFVTNLTGALAGLSKSSLSLATPSNERRRSRGKLTKPRPHPPSTWSQHFSSGPQTSSSSNLPSTLPSPLFTAPPSPDTPYSPFMESSVSLNPFSRRSSSSIFRPRRQSSQSGGEKLKKRRSTASIVSVSVSPDDSIPPVPPIPPVLPDVAPTSPLLGTSSPLAESPEAFRPRSLPPPSVVVVAPPPDSAVRKPTPLTSLVYTGKQGYLAHEEARLRRKQEIEQEERGRSATFDKDAVVRFPAESSESASPRPRRPTYLDVVDQSRPLRHSLYTSPSSPEYSLTPKRSASMYDARASQDDLVIMPAIPRAARPTAAHRPSSNAAKRWTIAVNHITDDGDFLQEIEKLRNSKKVEAGSISEGDEDGDDANEADQTDEEVVWMKARRAMLCVREIMRTETSYRNHLTKVWESETLNPSPTTPAVFMNHLPLLISVSSILSTRLEEDPSAWGVSAAFLGAEEDLERTLVSWCRIAGQVIVDLSPTSSGSTGRRASASYRKQPKDKEPEAPRRSNTAGSAGGSSSGHSSSKLMRKDKSRPASPNLAVPGGLGGLSGGKPLGLQDVAIMPSQRAPRYVLLFKDLLQQTPITSPSRSLVERALEGALRIAKACDEAQQYTDLLATT